MPSGPATGQRSTRDRSARSCRPGPGPLRRRSASGRPRERPPTPPPDRSGSRRARGPSAFGGSSNQLIPNASTPSSRRTNRTAAARPGAREIVDVQHGVAHGPDTIGYLPARCSPACASTTPSSASRRFGCAPTFRSRDPEFVREDGGWVLHLPPTGLARLEYQLELSDHDGDTVVVCDPGNPDRAPGAFGEKSVLLAPGYRPPAWLEEPAVAGELRCGRRPRARPRSPDRRLVACRGRAAAAGRPRRAGIRRARRRSPGTRAR